MLSVPIGGVGLGVVAAQEVEGGVVFLFLGFFEGGKEGGGLVQVTCLNQESCGASLGLFVAQTKVTGSFCENGEEVARRLTASFDESCELWQD